MSSKMSRTKIRLRWLTRPKVTTQSIRKTISSNSKNSRIMPGMKLSRSWMLKKSSRRRSFSTITNS